MRGAHSEPRVAAIDEIEIDQLLERLAQRLGRIVSGMIGAERYMRSKEGAGVRFKKTGDSTGDRHP